ncbi:MAG: [FeFe] hydrogenase H-cluster maturation GTPase HydF [Clostridium sp.]|nr:[FeFe] hydrogenase H-cluster maturation GTPase HydF [Clostridium sp.]
MLSTPKANRLHIGIFGKRNAGKSSLLNALVNQEISIVSDIAGTTTDAVEKTMEFLPLGPVVFIDTAGIDDIGDLGEQRIEKTKKIFDRTDIAIIVCDYEGWDNYEKQLYEEFDSRNIPVLAVVNKQDITPINADKLDEITKYIKLPLLTSLKNNREVIFRLKEQLINVCPDDFITPPSILGDIVQPKDTVVLVIPVDKEAPKGRIILPQVQVLRDLLDNRCKVFVTQETELKEALDELKNAPKLVITDSQAFKEVAQDVAEEIPLTSFSIVFARMKGDLKEFYKGAKAIDTLNDNDKVLICESCSHHQIEDDIARVKIPRWIKNKTGKNIEFIYHSGHDFPDELEQYKFLIHCGACMTNRKEVLSRIMKCKKANLPITNYGITIAHCTGILKRAVKPFNILDTVE